MKTSRRILPLALLVLAFGAASCVSDDWDYYDDDYDYDYDYARRSRRQRYDDYEDGYERGYRDAERRERDRDRRDRERDRRDRDGSHAKTPKGYVRAGSFQAGNAVECGIPTSHKIKRVRIAATSGTVSVNTVVLREGSAKTPFTVSRRLAAGETAEIDLGGARQATGLRISTGGRGGFDVFVH